MSEPQNPDDSEEIVAAELDEEDEPAPAAAPVVRAPTPAAPARPAPPRPARSTKTPVKKQNPDKSLKAMSVPIMATIGLLMLGLTAWAVLVLAGSQVWLWDRPNAKAMALVMLMCGPIAAVLFAGAVVFFRQIQREKAAWKESLAAAKAAKTGKAPLRNATPKPRAL